MHTFYLQTAALTIFKRLPLYMWKAVFPPSYLGAAAELVNNDLSCMYRSKQQQQQKTLHLVAFFIQNLNKLVGENLFRGYP